MANYITIDGGTTNTRLNLLTNGIVSDTIKLCIGAKHNTHGNAEYKSKIKNAIDTILDNNHIKEKDICRILCSGMITSEHGLCPLPHTSLPCGIRELHNTMHETRINDISTIPFVFVRGIKTDCTTPQNADMIRGEETELIGITQHTEKDCLYILPGSHSKHILTDDMGRICDFHTEFTGEMIESIAGNTILKDIIELDRDDTDYTALQTGYEYCCAKGINAALFKARTLKMFFGYSSAQCTSYFLGVVLCNEINNIINLNTKKVIIGGKKHLRKPMEYLIKSNSNMEVVPIDDELSANAPAYGIIRIYEYNGGI